MLPGQVKELIARLDAGTFTAFVGGLSAAESARLGVKPSDVVMSDALNENDGGLDARLEDVPAGVPSAIPAGLVGCQLKATKKKAPGAFDLTKELEKAGPTQVFERGGTYVLVSSQDLNPGRRLYVSASSVAELG